MYMNNLEKADVLKESKLYKSRIIYWDWCVDILCLYEGAQTAGENVHKYIKLISIQIQFSNELQNSHINFPDITISKERH